MGASAGVGGVGGVGGVDGVGGVFISLFVQLNKMPRSVHSG